MFESNPDIRGSYPDNAPEERPMTPDEMNTRLDADLARDAYHARSADATGKLESAFRHGNDTFENEPGQDGDIIQLVNGDPRLIELTELEKAQRQGPTQEGLRLQAANEARISEAGKPLTVQEMQQAHEDLQRRERIEAAMKQREQLAANTAQYVRENEALFRLLTSENYASYFSDEGLIRLIEQQENGESAMDILARKAAASPGSHVAKIYTYFENMGARPSLAPAATAVVEQMESNDNRGILVDIRTFLDRGEKTAAGNKAVIEGIDHELQALENGTLLTDELLLGIMDGTVIEVGSRITTLTGALEIFARNERFGANINAQAQGFLDKIAAIRSNREEAIG